MILSFFFFAKVRVVVGGEEFVEKEEIEHDETLGALADGDENNRILDDVEYY